MFRETMRRFEGFAHVGEFVRQGELAAEGEHFIPRFVLFVHGEEHEGAVADDRAVEVFLVVGDLRVAVVNGVAQVGIVVAGEAVRDEAGGHDDELDDPLQIFGDLFLVEGFHGGFPVPEELIGAVPRHLRAEAADIRDFRVAADGEEHFVLLGQGVADARPEIVPRRMEDDFRIDEGMVRRALPVPHLAERAVQVVDDAHRRDGGAVRAERGEGEDGLIHVFRGNLCRVHCPAAADGKDHVRLLDFGDLRQRFRRFKGAVVAVLERTEDVKFPFAGFAEGRFRRGAGFLPADDDRGLAESAADGRHGVIGVRADGVAGEELIRHTLTPFRKLMQRKHFLYYTALSPSAVSAQRNPKKFLHGARKKMGNTPIFFAFSKANVLIKRFTPTYGS